MLRAMALLAKGGVSGLHSLSRQGPLHPPLTQVNSDFPFSHVPASFLTGFLWHIQARSPFRQPALVVPACAAHDNPRADWQAVQLASQPALANESSSSSPGPPPPSSAHPSSLPLPPDLCSWPQGGGAVHRNACVHPSVVVEWGAVVQAGAVVEEDCCIGACSVVGQGVRIGARSVLRHSVSLQHCTLGHDCILHNGVSIGQDGFGFFVNEEGEMVKKPQELSVIVGNHVEVGANSCIDRGSWRDTEIGDHTKLDNLVQVGHNVKIGRCCLLCGQVGIGGSAELGDYVVLGGKAGVADHVKVHSQVRIAAKTGVIADITESGEFAGFPAVPAREWRRSVIAIRRLGRKLKPALAGSQEAPGGGEETS